MNETLKGNETNQTPNKQGVGSQTLGYVALIEKWRLKAKKYMKAHRGETGCVPCEKIIIADTLKMCARELKSKIKKAT